MKDLIRLWWTQKRRLFRWTDLFVGAYFAFLFLLIGGIVYMELDEQLGELRGSDTMVTMMIVIAAAMLISDLMFKFMLQNDSVLMDDFLKTKPVSQHAWNRFVLFSCTANGWNLMLPFIVGCLSFLFLNVGQALLAVLMAFVMSAMNSMLLACIRKSDGWELKLPMFLALFFYIVGAIVFVIVCPLLSLPSMAALCLWTLLTLIGIYTLYIYFSHLVRYDEHQERVSHARSLGVGSLFSMEYASVLRSKRLRSMAILIPLCLLPQLYTSTMMDDPWFLFIPVMLVIFMASAVSAQWVFGVEANYFQALWTKPVAIETLLVNKYRFYALLNMLAALLTVPAIWVSGVRPLVILACWLFCAGIGNLILMPTCLISSRIDLFSSAFFNYQGANKGINLYGLIFVVPFVLVAFCGGFLGINATCIIISVLGLLGFTLHRVFLGWLARKFMARRYARFEAYMEG